MRKWEMLRVKNLAAGTGSTSLNIYLKLVHNKINFSQYSAIQVIMLCFGSVGMDRVLQVKLIYGQFYKDIIGK